MSRPEHQAPPEIFYDEAEAAKYSSNSRMIQVQSEMAERAIELLNLPSDCEGLILDLGCGSGLSGEIITEQGHQWIGLDISSDMLKVANDREVEGDLLQWDLGQALSFRTGMFDGAISISMLQWLCNADKSNHSPRRRLGVFFASLYKALRHGSRAVFQFYPENDQQTQMITEQAMRAGFTGGLVVDFPNSTKAKKVYLCLMCGPQAPLPDALGEEKEELHVRYERSPVMFESKMLTLCSSKIKAWKKNKSAKGANRRELILQKKDRRRRMGKQVPLDSKFTGRRRKAGF